VLDEGEAVVEGIDDVDVPPAHLQETISKKG
jgi:hypothetical protein